MDGLKQGGLTKGITEFLILVDHLEVETQPSWRWMKYHAE